MRIREIVAENLRRRCEGDQSVAHICRKMGINRQQFNKYLAGVTLPNERSLDKICHYFGIQESELLNTDSSSISIDSVPANDTLSLLKFVHQLVSKKLNYDKFQTSLTDGVYHTYFGHINGRDSIVRSVTIIKKDGNLTSFRRITGISNEPESTWADFTGDHRGMVIDRANAVFFQGMNSLGTEEPSLVCVQSQPMSTLLLAGFALIVTVDGPALLPVVMEKSQDAFDLKEEFRRYIKSYPFNSPDISSSIRNALRSQNDKLHENYANIS